MKEIKAIIEAYNNIDTATTCAALATVVKVEGSSYRRTGARMLVLDNGMWVGGISGGCLEGDALKRARIAIAKSESTLITYDTTEDDPHQIGVGLGCNGIIDVLFMPLNFGDKHNPVEILKTCVGASRQTHVLITVTRLEGSWTTIKAGDVIKFNGTDSLQDFNSSLLKEQLTKAVMKQLYEGKSAPKKILQEDGRFCDVFIEVLPPEINVQIMGFQYDVYPFTRLLKEIGWRVTVIAGLQKVNKNIAAIADEVTAPENFAGLTVDEHCAIILMSHDYKTDKYNLPKALATSAPYIGLLGPATRSQKLVAELIEEGYQITPDDLARIHAPVGLDIGAVTPEEIALSMAAEIKAVFAHRAGGFLKLRKTSIHEREKSDDSKTQPA